MTPFCESCGAHVSVFDDGVPGQHKATCPWGDPVFARAAAEFLAGVDFRVSQFEAVQS